MKIYSPPNVSTLQIALAHLRKFPGHYLFPIRRDAKSPPLFPRNLELASNDPEQIKKWAAKFPGANWGVALAKSGLIVVDVDTKPGKVGAATYALLGLLDEWPETFSVRTPSGGLHHYYSGPHVFALGENGFGKDIDSPNYVLIPGCTVGGKPYLVDGDFSVAPAPDFFGKYLKPRERTAPSAEPVVEYDKPENEEWAIHYLRKDAPPAIEGQGGELTTLKVAAELRDHGISEPRSVDLMNEFYNVVGRCDPEWEFNALRQKIANAYAYANLNAPGERTAENEFAGDPAQIVETDEQRIIREQRQREKLAREARKDRPRGLKAEDFVAYLPEHKYIYLPTGALWPPESVNASVGKGTTRKLDKGRAVQVMTWVPGAPAIIADRLVNEDWLEAPGCATFNLYRPPAIGEGDASKAEPWRTHLRKLYPTDAEHMEKWFAHRVQRPGDKINHALVLGGPTRIGKDTLIEPLKHAVGPWNFKEVTASQAMDGKNNGYMQAVVLRIAEARDFGEKNRYSFYEHWKPWLTSPPNTVTVADKYIKAHPVFNVVGVLITTNHKAGGLFLPPEDARHFVAWSDMKRETIDAIDPEYFRKLYRWYAEGGIAHVAAFLRELDLSGFDAAEPPPLTEAFWQMAQSYRQESDQDLADMIASRNVQAFTRDQLLTWAIHDDLDDVAESLRGGKAASGLNRRLLECGYERVRNHGEKEGRWKIAGRSARIYALSSLSQPERIKAALRVVSEAKEKPKNEPSEFWE